MTKQQRTRADLSTLTSEELWQLPYAWSIHDDYQGNIDEIESLQADTALAKHIHKTTKLPLAVAKELTQIAQVLCQMERSGEMSQDDYKRAVDVILYEADRYVRVASLLHTGNKSMPRVIGSYVDETLDAHESPKAFLLRKLRNATIFFAVTGVLGVLSLRIKADSGFSRTGCLLLLGIVTTGGILNYGHMFRQYQARKQLSLFLAEKGTA